MGFCLICQTCTYEVIHDVTTSITQYFVRLSEVKNELIVTSLDRIEMKLVYMIQKLKRRFIKLHFVHTTYAYDVNSDVN